MLLGALALDPIREGHNTLSPKHPGEMQKNPQIYWGKLKSFTLIPVLKKIREKEAQK